MLSHFSFVWLFVTPWTAACQAPLSMGFSRQEYWSGWLCPPPGDLPEPGIKPTSPVSPALAGRLFITIDTWEALGGRLIIPGRESMCFKSQVQVLSLLAPDLPEPPTLGGQNKDSPDWKHGMRFQRWSLLQEWWIPMYNWHQEIYFTLDSDEY